MTPGRSGQGPAPGASVGGETSPQHSLKPRSRPLPVVTVETALGLDVAVGLALAIFWAVGTRLAPADPVPTGVAGSCRVESLDGLRGFLALAVLLHHGPMMADELRTGRWEVGSTFRLFLGRTPVNLFFMTTAFLFWSKVLAAPGPLALGPHLRSRFFRIAPLYVVSALAVLAVVLARSGFLLRESYQAFGVEAGSLVLGMGVLFLQDCNGVPLTPITGGVTWTLAVEWVFYLSLPALSLFRTPRRFLALSIAAVSAWLFTQSTLPGGALGMFTAGMLAAQLHRRTAPVEWLRGPAAAVIGLIGVVALPTLTDRPASPVALLAVFPLFLAVANGNTLFGLLKTRGARHLGAVSYGVYLLHGLVLFTVFHAAATVVPPARWTAPLEWTLTLGAGLVVIPLAAWTRRRIEAPFLAYERRLRPGPPSPVAPQSQALPDPKERPVGEPRPSAARLNEIWPGALPAGLTRTR